MRQILSAQPHVVSLDQQVRAGEDPDDLGAFVAVADDHPDEEAIARIGAQHVRQVPAAASTAAADWWSRAGSASPEAR